MEDLVITVLRFLKLEKVEVALVTSATHTALQDLGCTSLLYTSPDGINLMQSVWNFELLW